MRGVLAPPWAPLWLPPGAFELNPSHPLAAGLIGFWPFQGSGKDYSIYNNTATFTASPGFSAGLLGPALSLNGSSQNAKAPAISAYQAANLTAVTMSCWFFPTAQQDGGLIVQNGSGAELYELRYDRSSSTVLNFVTDANGGVVAGSTGTPALNAWHHGLGVYDGAHMTVYLDGVAGTPQAATGGLTGSAQVMGFGNDPVNGAPWFAGSLANAMVYSRALSVQEITELYRSPFSTLRPVVQRQYYQGPQSVSSYVASQFLMAQ